jgi:hypothetical protein
VQSQKTQHREQQQEAKRRLKGFVTEAANPEVGS